MGSPPPIQHLRYKLDALVDAIPVFLLEMHGNKIERVLALLL
jgi:hypothetical protein